MSNIENNPYRVEVVMNSTMHPGTVLKWQVMNPTISYIRDRKAEGAKVTLLEGVMPERPQAGEKKSDR
jgi:hypothetical protein